MSDPRISVIVPTLRRADTLRRCLRTMLSQDFSDCEFVVQNNGHDAAVEAVVRDSGDERVRHFATETVVPMVDNWELALTHARGEIITLIGDDDGLLPDACAIAATLFSCHDIELLSWTPYWYFWPKYFHAGFSNRLLAEVNFDFFAEEISSRAELTRVYNYVAPYSRLPMIYNSFMHRRVIDRVRGELGRYFVGISPDVTSGLVNAARSKSFLRLSRPLSVVGTSQHSTGHTVAYRGDKTTSTMIMERDFPAPNIDDRLPPGGYLQVGLARDLLLVKDLMLADDASLDLNYRGLMQLVADTINDHPDSYDELIDTIAAIAARHGIDASEIIVPTRTNMRSAPEIGTAVLGRSKIRFVIDGNAVGLQGIDDAVALMAQISPQTAALDPVVRGVAELRAGETMFFTTDGNGRSALLDGWSDPEREGAWSIGKRSVLKLSVVPGRTPLQLALRCTPFLHPDHPQLDIVCSIGRSSESWRFAIDREPFTPSFAVPLDAVDADGSVTITLDILNPMAPAACNVNRDARLLGILLQSIDVIEQPLQTAPLAR
jgi:hypothetical protein